MLPIFDGVRDVTVLSTTLRMLLAVVCGGLIGLEREYKRRPAGFRTHILICLGAAMTTLTSQFLYLNLHYYTDMARLGAQVVAGIGFIGAGAIIVTRRRRVKGLTTAAASGGGHCGPVPGRRVLRGRHLRHGADSGGGDVPVQAGVPDAGQRPGGEPLYGVQ